MKILVVDDDKLGRELLARSLEKFGFEVVECGDGMEAFQLLEHGAPALLVLDYDMPEFDGAQMCDIIRHNPNPDIAEIPIIMLTAFSGEEREVACLRAGADDFVTKPINVAALRARIETHLRLRAMRDELKAQKV